MRSVCNNCRRSVNLRLAIRKGRIGEFCKACRNKKRGITGKMPVILRGPKSRIVHAYTPER